jgi:cobalt-zinc-cadmium efflux system protein
VVKNLRKIWKVFLQGVPEGISLEKVEKAVKEATGALSAYHTHIWSLDGEKNLLNIHLVVSDDIKRSEIINMKRKVRETAAKMGMEHVTVEIDFQSEAAGGDCF